MTDQPSTQERGYVCACGRHFLATAVWHDQTEGPENVEPPEVSEERYRQWQRANVAPTVYSSTTQTEVEADFTALQGMVDAYRQQALRYDWPLTERLQDKADAALARLKSSYEQMEREHREAMDQWNEEMAILGQASLKDRERIEELEAYLLIIADGEWNERHVREADGRDLDISVEAFARQALNTPDTPIDHAALVADQNATALLPDTPREVRTMTETERWPSIEDDLRRLESHMEHYPDASIDTGCAAALRRIARDLRDAYAPSPNTTEDREP